MENIAMGIEGYREQEWEDAAYRYLKAKAESDPENLSEMEGGLLLLFCAVKHLDLQEKKRKYIEYYQGLYDRAYELLLTCKNGQYHGDDFFADYQKIIAPGTDNIVRMLGDIDLVVKLYKLCDDFAILENAVNPIDDTETPRSYSDPYSAKQWACIEEERENLEAAGYPEDKIEHEACKRGTFKAFFGPELLPSIQVE